MNDQQVARRADSLGQALSRMSDARTDRVVGAAAVLDIAGEDVLVGDGIRSRRRGLFSFSERARAAIAARTADEE
jgi:hypothetical protein